MIMLTDKGKMDKPEDKPVYIPHNNGVLSGTEAEISGGFMACRKAQKWCDDNDIKYTYVWATPPPSRQNLTPPSSILFSFESEEDRVMFVLAVC